MWRAVTSSCAVSWLPGDRRPPPSLVLAGVQTRTPGIDRGLQPDGQDRQTDRQTDSKGERGIQWKRDGVQV